MPNIEKKIMMRELMKKIEKRPYIFFAQFNRLSTGDMSQLRRNLRKTADSCAVVKNTIAKRIFEELGIKEVQKLIEGQIFVATSKDEPQKISKILVDFAKEKEESFRIKGAMLDGICVQNEYVRELAKLPSRHELLTKVAVGIKSPITGFVLTLNALIRSFVVVLNQVAQKKGEVQA